MNDDGENEFKKIFDRFVTRAVKNLYRNFAKNYSEFRGRLCTKFALKSNFFISPTRHLHFYKMNYYLVTLLVIFSSPTSR